MSAAEQFKNLTRDAVKGFISNLSDEEKQKVLNWSERAVVIRTDNTLTKKEKLTALSQLENSELAIFLFSKIATALKNKIWTNQSWARRLGFVGLATGISFGGAAVGIATMGAGIGVPLVLMTAAGGVVLGAAIDEIKKEI